MKLSVSSLIMSSSFASELLTAQLCFFFVPSFVAFFPSHYPEHFVLLVRDRLHFPGWLLQHWEQHTWTVEWGEGVMVIITIVQVLKTEKRDGGQRTMPRCPAARSKSQRGHWRGHWVFCAPPDCLASWGSGEIWALRLFCNSLWFCWDPRTWKNEWVLSLDTFPP